MTARKRYFLVKFSNAKVEFLRSWRRLPKKHLKDLAHLDNPELENNQLGIPEDRSDPAWAVGTEALSDLAAYAGERGVRVACETGPESIALMKEFLDRIPVKGIAVNYDPANSTTYNANDYGYSTCHIKPFFTSNWPTGYLNKA